MHIGTFMLLQRCTKSVGGMLSRPFSLLDTNDTALLQPWPSQSSSWSRLWPPVNVELLESSCMSLRSSHSRMCPMGVPIFHPGPIMKPAHQPTGLGWSREGGGTPVMRRRRHSPPLGAGRRVRLSLPCQVPALSVLARFAFRLPSGTGACKV
jgi:hypothetical protein